MLMALAMLVLPPLIVVGWSLMERDIGGRLERETTAAAEEVVALIDEEHGISDARVWELAARSSTRIRVVREDGEVVVDADADRGTDLVHQIGTLFFGPDGAPSLREFDETLKPVVKRPEVRSMTHGGVVTGCRSSPAGKLLVCHAARAVVVDGLPHVVYVQESSRRAVRALYDLRYHLTRLSIVMFPVALAFSWWMGRRMVRPIEWLRARVLEKARSANPRADIDLHGGDEVRDLAEAFNDLLGALDERRQANEAFVADLVHEFKNPVAAIRACAESLGSGGADEKRAARIAKILEDSSTRLDALVSQFLELARAEAGMPNEPRAEVDLGALARGVASAATPSFPRVGFVVEAETAVVVGVTARLDSLVRNLVDNAASFAGDEGEVRITVRRVGRDVVLEVSDTGPGISADDLPRVFDRFFTTRAGAEARQARSSSLRGSGLGLALVKAVAEAHDGVVSASSTPGRGATFRVALPAR
jgi:two-component system sensor histidine kinase ChvG